MPKISVVMSVHEDFRFLNEAVQSILNQSFEDFELIIIDDGSKDPEPVRSLSGLDRRIRTMANGRNLGAAASANRAIAQARAPIIARLDADDIACPTRLEALWQAFDKDPSLVLVGSNYVRISESGEPLNMAASPAEHPDIVWTALFTCPFCHSSTAYRKDVFDRVRGYDGNFDAALDYDLWMRVLRVGRGHNLQEPLVQYRQNSLGISATRPERQRFLAGAVREAAWSALGLDPPQETEGPWLRDMRLSAAIPQSPYDLVERYLGLCRPVLPRLISAFPSLRQDEVARLGRRLLGDARDYLTLLSQAIDEAASAAPLAPAPE